jgi:hypothetical protein
MALSFEYLNKDIVKASGLNAALMLGLQFVAF